MQRMFTRDENVELKAKEWTSTVKCNKVLRRL